MAAWWLLLGTGSEAVRLCWPLGSSLLAGLLCVWAVCCPARIRRSCGPGLLFHSVRALRARIVMALPGALGIWWGAWVCAC